MGEEVDIRGGGKDGGNGQLLLGVAGRQQCSWRESNHRQMVGGSQQVDVEGAVITGETLAFSVELRSMLKMPSGMLSF